MLVPVGIAYAVASGVPGIHGLYATIVPLLAYALFGPSRILVLGPDSSLAAVILAVVAAAVRRRPDACRRHRRHDGDRVRDRVHSGRPGTPGIRHRTPFKAYPLWIYERHCLDGLDQSIAEGLRVLDRSDGPLRNLVAIAKAVLGGRANWTCVPGRRRNAGGDPAAEGQQTRAGHPDRRGGSNHRRGCAGPGGPRGRVGTRLPPARPAVVRHPLDRLRRYRPGPHRRPRRRPGVVRRHQRIVAHLCGADADVCRSQPGDGRSRCRQPRRRILSGLSHQQQFVTHAGG